MSFQRKARLGLGADILDHVRASAASRMEWTSVFRSAVGSVSHDLPLVLEVGRQMRSSRIRCSTDEPRESSGMLFSFVRDPTFCSSIQPPNTADTASNLIGLYAL